MSATWTISIGNPGQFELESVDNLNQNPWTISTGIDGRFHRNTQTARNRQSFNKKIEYQCIRCKKKTNRL